MTDVQEFRERAQQANGRIKEVKIWALRQSADLRAKAEMMEDVDEVVEVYGTDDPDELYEAADEIEAVLQNINL